MAAIGGLQLNKSTDDGHWGLLSVLCVSFHYFWDTLIRFHVFRFWFSGTVATDVSITLVLLWQFYQIKSSCTKRCISYYCHGSPLLTGLDLMVIHMLFSLIHRLMASAIRTGTITSVVSILIFILFLCDNNCEFIPQHCWGWLNRHCDYSVDRSCDMPWPDLRSYHALQPELQKFT